LNGRKSKEKETNILNRSRKLDDSIGYKLEKTQPKIKENVCT